METLDFTIADASFSQRPLYASERRERYRRRPAKRALPTSARPGDTSPEHALTITEAADCLDGARWLLHSLEEVPHLDKELRVRLMTITAIVKLTAGWFRALQRSAEEEG